jgi:hypothetical protein
MMLPTRMNWHKLFSYVEVACFCSAWAIGMLVAISANQQSDDHAAARQFAAANEAPGVQAAMHKELRPGERKSASLRIGRR